MLVSKAQYSWTEERDVCGGREEETSNHKIAQTFILKLSMSQPHANINKAKKQKKLSCTGTCMYTYIRRWDSMISAICNIHPMDISHSHNY